jgi:putative ABC transport system substrate-binding protein
MTSRKEARTGARFWVLASLLLLLFARPALAAGQPFSEWFRYGAEVASAWQFTVDSAKPLQVSIRPKNAGNNTRAYRVLVLYPRASSAYDTEITRILRVFDDKEINAAFTVINFETADAAGKAAIQFAEKNKFDLIYAMGSESTAWLYENYLGGAIPVVSVCSKDPVQLKQIKDYERGSGTNFAYTSLNVQVEVQLAYLIDMSPDLRNLAILVDSKNVSAVKTQAEPIADAARKSGIQPIMAAVQDPKLAGEELAQIIPNVIRAMRKTDPDLSKSIFLITGSTSVFGEMATINKYAQRVPVVSMIPEIVTTGSDTALFGIGISFESNAQLAAIYGIDILTGRAKVGDLKVGVVSPPDIAVSFLKAHQIGKRVPFHFFEGASFVYDVSGRAVRAPVRAAPTQD